MHTDPISDLLTRIRNAQKAGHDVVMIPHSRLKQDICNLLEQHGYLKKARVDRTGKFPLLRLTLSEEKPLTSLKRISKPSLRVYKKFNEWKPVRQGYGIAIVSTSQGVMTATEAQEKKIGGELLCEVY